MPKHVSRTIDSNLADELDSELTINKLDAVYSKLKNNKSPGWDGLTAEFFKIFWEDIRLILFNCYQESINNCSLSPSQRIGVLTLIQSQNNQRNWYTSKIGG